MPHSIVIVDDHILVAQGLTGLIEKTMKNYQVLYEVDTGKELFERFAHPENIPDIVLLDVIMPEMDGFKIAEWHANHPAVRILAVSGQDDEFTILKILRCGAHGYLLKNVHTIILKNALDSMAEKDYFYPEWITHKIVKYLTDEKLPGPDISARELEFLNHAITELTYKEIADKMCCSPRTVEGYRDNLFQKLGVKTRVGLVMTALRAKLISQ